MSAILNCPVELLLQITRDLDIQDISAFSRSCRAIHKIAIPLLYQKVKDDPAIMCWAVDEDRINTVQRLLDAGANPNVSWVQRNKRMARLAILHYDRTPRLVLRPRETHEFSLQLALDHGLDGAGDEGQGEDDAEVLEDDEQNQEYQAGFFPNPDRDHLSSPQLCYWTPLHIAVRWGNDKIIDLLLRHGADIHAVSRGFCECMLPSEDSRSIPSMEEPMPLWKPLHTAICSGHESTVELLVSRGASMDISTRFPGSDLPRVTALHTACASNFVPALRFLIDEGHQADLEVEDYQGRTPMSYAYHAGSWRSIDFLLEKGATLNARIGDSTLLNHACFEGRFAEALRFIELGADINAFFEQLPPSIITTLHCCCMPVGSQPALFPDRESGQEHLRGEVIRQLIKAGVNIEAKNNHSRTPLMEAAYFHSTEAVEVLLAAGADINSRDEMGANALEKACESLGLSSEGAMLETVKALIAYMPSDTDIFDALGKLCAFSGNHLDKAKVVPLLIEHKGAPYLHGQGGQELFLEALFSHKYDICDALLDCGLRHPNEQEVEIIMEKLIDTDSTYGLRYILKSFKHSPLAEVILSKRRVLDAVEKKRTDCAILLILAGAPTTYKTDGGQSCLMEACRMGETTIAKLLLERGADPNEVNKRGEYALLYPVLNSNQPLIKLLLDHGAVMHSHPLGTNTGACCFGALDTAIRRGLGEVVMTMISHRSYEKSSGAERDNHLKHAFWAVTNGFEDGTILGYLLSAGGLDPNVVFDDTGASLLQMCVELNNETATRVLVQRGADIHMALAEDVTVLEWAIEFSSVEVLKIMLDRTFINQLQGVPDVLIIRYARAACRRQDPDILCLLLNCGLKPNACDEDGSSLLLMFCKTTDTERPEDLGWPKVKVGDRSAECMNVLLDVGVDPEKKNDAETSAMDLFLRMTTYSGS